MGRASSEGTIAAFPSFTHPFIRCLCSHGTTSPPGNARAAGTMAKPCAEAGAIGVPRGGGASPAGCCGGRLGLIGEAWGREGNAILGGGDGVNRETETRK